jgi:hypothetical protein
MQMRYPVLGMELLMIMIAFAGVFTLWHGMELAGQRAKSTRSAERGYGKRFDDVDTMKTNGLFRLSNSLRNTIALWFLT